MLQSISNVQANYALYQTIHPSCYAMQPMLSLSHTDSLAAAAVRCILFLLSLTHWQWQLQLYGEGL